MPHVWLVEDDALQAEQLSQLVRQVAPRATVSFFTSISEVRAGLKDATISPNVAIVDMMLPIGPGQMVARFGGEGAAHEIRNRYPHTEIVFRTAFDAQVATRLPEAIVIPKNDEQALIDSLSSILAGQGFNPRSTITRKELPPLTLTTGPVSQRLWAVGAFAAGGSVWVATVLQIAPEESRLANIILVTGGGICGALLGLGAGLRGFLRWGAAAVGATGIVVFGLLIPLLHAI